MVVPGSTAGRISTCMSAPAVLLTRNKTELDRVMMQCSSKCGRAERAAADTNNVFEERHQYSTYYTETFIATTMLNITHEITMPGIARDYHWADRLSS